MRRSLVLVVLATALASGCGGGQEGPTGATPSTGETFAPRPSPAAGWAGTASFEMTGGVDTRADLTMVIGTVTLDPRELVVAWTDDAGNDALAILWSGTERPELGVPLDGFLIAVGTPETRAHGSYGDEWGRCVVSLDSFGPDGMAGTFDCPELELPDRALPTARATGSFTVSRTG